MNSHLKKAAALSYDKQSAPKVVASGSGILAQKIIERAKELDIAMFQNSALVESLVSLEIGDEIPPELYSAVVEVFIWLYESEQKAQISRD